MAQEQNQGAGSPGADLIAVERERQVTQEGWSAAHDATLERGELNFAAQSYLWAATMATLYSDRPREFATATRDPVSGWPWLGPDTWKPSPDPIRNLVRAGALIAAEIDRLLSTTDPDLTEQASGPDPR
jgi:hypothetical protein